MQIPQLIKYKDQIFEHCQIGHVIKPGDVVARFSAYGNSFFPVERIGKRYAIVRVNPVSTDHYPLVYTDNFKQAGKGMTSVICAMYKAK